MSNTNQTPVTIVITPTSVADAVVKSSAFNAFVNDIVPKQLTIDNCQKGGLFTTDNDGNQKPWTAVTLFPIFGNTR